jgi:hypothetical protein
MTVEDIPHPRQGIRYTVDRLVRQEILDRLSELNHERYAAEVAAGLQERGRASGHRRESTAEQGSLFDA